MGIVDWLPLVGVLIGTCATIWLQWLTRRQVLTLSITEQKIALRVDRKEAINAFLESAQTVDELIDGVHHHATGATDIVRSAMHQLWFRQKCIDVVGSAQLRSAAFEFTQAMNDVVGGSVPANYADVWDCMNSERTKFLTAARLELHNPTVDD